MHSHCSLDPNGTHDLPHVTPTCSVALPACLDFHDCVELLCEVIEIFVGGTPAQKEVAESTLKNTNSRSLIPKSMTYDMRTCAFLDYHRGPHMESELGTID
jgi:hypothetical protein